MRSLFIVFLLCCAWILAVPLGAEPSGAEPVPPAAVITAPGRQLDTYLMRAGRADGWRSGDRVTFRRATHALGQGIVLDCDDHQAHVVVMTNGVTLRAGDGVSFVAHRDPLPATEHESVAIHVPLPQPALRPNPASGWIRVGSIAGFEGDDWMTRTTRTCRVWAPESQLDYMNVIVDHLDDSYDINERFTGLSPHTPLDFYFFSLEQPFQLQPRFEGQLGSPVGNPGVTLPHMNVCLINVGDWASKRLFDREMLDEICRHEMNHLFCWGARGANDRMDTWHWFVEAPAYTIQNTVRPLADQPTVDSLKNYFRTQPMSDINWSGLILTHDVTDARLVVRYQACLISICYYLQTRYGPGTMARILHAAASEDIEDAFQQVTGKGVAALEADWRTFYELR